MSTNIDSLHVLALDAWIRAADVVEILRQAKAERTLPENCFMRRMEKPAMDALLQGKADEAIPVGHPTDGLLWSGVRSGDSYQSLLQTTIASKVHGIIELVAIWEDGGFTGLRIKDGVARAHEVKFSLGAALR